MKDSRPRILAIMQLPPPIHGQSIMNRTIYTSKTINAKFNLNTIPLHFTTLEKLGKPSIEKLVRMIYYAIIILKKLLIFKPDIIYFTISPTGFAFYRDVLYVFIIKIFQKPIAFHLHGKGIQKNLTSSINRLLYASVFQNTHIILLSKLLKSDVKNVLKKNQPVYCLANGIKEKDIKKPNRDDIPRSEPIILFLSNIVETKGVFILLEAARILSKKKIKFKLLLAGGIARSIPEAHLIKTIKDYNLTDCVEYVGAKYGNEKYSVLKKSDIFVFPTYYANEAYPLVLLEAMQAGLPVISTFEGAIPEIITNNETGFIVGRKNPQQLADKMEVLVRDKTLREKMGRKGHEKYQKNYTKSIFENNLTQIFNDIIRLNRSQTI